MTQAGARSFFPTSRAEGLLYAGVLLVAMSALLVDGRTLDLVLAPHPGCGDDAL
jgi:hypothetical protein